MCVCAIEHSNCGLLIGSRFVHQAASEPRYDPANTERHRAEFSRRITAHSSSCHHPYLPTLPLCVRAQQPAFDSWSICSRQLRGTASPDGRRPVSGATRWWTAGIGPLARPYRTSTVRWWIRRLVADFPAGSAPAGTGWHRLAAPNQPNTPRRRTL